MRAPQTHTPVGTAGEAAAKAGGGGPRDTKGADRKPAHKVLWTPLEDEVLIIYVKLLRPGDYDGTVTSGQTSPGAVHDPVASDKPVSWDRVAHALNSEFIMWKEKYPGVHLNVHKRNGKSCRSRWKYHVSLARTNRRKKIPLTEADDEYIIYMQQKLSNKWSRIAAELTARFGVYRTDNDVKNRWFSKLHGVVHKRQMAGIPLHKAPLRVPDKPIARKAPDSRPAVESKLDNLRPSEAPLTATPEGSALRLEQLVNVPRVIFQRLKDLQSREAGSAVPLAQAPAACHTPQSPLAPERQPECQPKHQKMDEEPQQADYSTSSGASVEDEPDTAPLSSAQSPPEDVPAHVKEYLKAVGELRVSSATFLDVHNRSAAMQQERLESTHGPARHTGPAHSRAMPVPSGGSPSAPGGRVSNATLQRAVEIMVKKVEKDGNLSELYPPASNSSLAGAGSRDGAGPGPSAHGMSSKANSSGVREEPSDHAEEQSLLCEVQQLLGSQADLMAQLPPGPRKRQRRGRGLASHTQAYIHADEILAEVDLLLGTHPFGTSPGGLNMHIKPEPEL
eukprot:jgi/Tetstr1/426287/TSEL_016604.t1